MAARSSFLLAALGIVCPLALGMIPVAAGAADVSGNLALVSDYRFRGISSSNRHPAVQGGLDVGLPGGWFAGAWGSSIARYGGAHTEVDLYGGKSGTVAGLTYSVTAAGYLYPRGSRVDFAELQAEVARVIGPATLTIEGAYAPVQHNVAVANTYVGARAEVAVGDTPLRLRLRGGYEEGFYEGKTDWEAGLSYGSGRLSASVSVVGTEHVSSREAGKLGRTGLTFALATVF
ncbi:TorF family putative porin [Sphingomonas profundi]|uniref:TorF family putative porin n=1 Tax=Alterirhizorhabdus profundi TaxID=2681549 RepID=UPI0012E78DB0|nr:TorF family putative porin [Sphingomonas profundi]